MNFHIFVAIITCVFYVFLRIYKSNVLEKKNKKNKVTSNLLYVLFLPAVLYLTNFIFYKSTTNTINNINIKEQMDIGGGVISEDLLSIPYPESSFRSSNLN